MPKLKPPFKLNVPMLLTWMRIAMIPLVIGIFYLPETWMTMGTKNATAMLMFVIAAITDALDGFLARRYQGWATPMGAFLDPVADKLLVSAALVALVGLDRCDMLVALVIIRMSHRNPVNSMNVNERSDVKINADATAAQAA